VFGLIIPVTIGYVLGMLLNQTKKQGEDQMNIKKMTVNIPQ
jgi:hypothetical protein